MIFRIPTALRPFADDRAEVRIDASAATAADALKALFAKYPGLRDRVCDEAGLPRRHVNVFVGDENIRFVGGLATPVSPDAVITILPAVSGG